MVRAARWWSAVVLGGALLVAVPGGTVGALVGFDISGPGNESTNTTFTTSTRYVTDTARVDLEDAPPPECDFPGSEPVLVDETTVGPELASVEVRFTLGVGQTIYVGENEQTPVVVLPGQQNFDTLSIYETVVTQYFQATAAGEACAVVASAARFTG